MTPRILVVDGNTAATNGANSRAGGSASGPRYAAVLRGICPAADIAIVQPADGPLAALALSAFDGVAFTGSALNVYDMSPEITRQIDLAKAALDAGCSLFGSCWGLQVIATALGGRVHKNPKGREIGIARRIQRSATGAAHPLLDGKGAVFDAICVHLDEVVEVPAGMSVLAGNAISDVQAASYGDALAGPHAWAVQYHPEYDFNEIAAVMQRYGKRLLADGLFADEAALQRYLGDFRALHADPARHDLAWAHGLDGSVLERGQRERELANWINFILLPRAENRAARS